jgi:large subunit ribosomal protein L32
MVVRMRHTRAHTANRRSHHALESKNLSACSQCQAMKMPHVVCTSCGMYKGNQVLILKK